MVLTQKPQLNTSCVWHTGPLLPPENPSIAQGMEQPTQGGNLLSSLATDRAMGDGAPQRQGEEEYNFLISML